MIRTELCPADEAGIQKAAALLRQGQPVALPTETVYGIAADAASNEAVQRIFAAKGRPQDNPLIVHIGGTDMLEGVARQVPPRAQRLAEAFWPGPLTMILPRGPRVCDAVCAGLDTVGVRMPAHPVAQAVLRQSGIPFAAPSANLSGSPSPTNAADVWQDMDGRLPLILDGGPSPVGVESTVVTVAGQTPMILRPGCVTKEQLEEVLGEEVLLSHAVTQALAKGEKASSPGMKYRHYAPRARVILLKGSLPQYIEYVRAQRQTGAWCLCFEGEQEHLPLPCVAYGREGDGPAQAHDLFTALRLLDKKGAQVVYARCPRQQGVELAVYNRLIRAAAYRVVEL